MGLIQRLRDRDAARQRLYARATVMQIASAIIAVFAVVTALFLVVDGRPDWTQTSVLTALALAFILTARYRYR